MTADPASIDALDLLYLQSLRDNCLTEDGQPARILSLGGQAPAVEDGHSDLIMLNISGYHFRLVNWLYFGNSAGLNAELSRLMRSAAPLAGNLLADAYGELSNMICGAINRGLCSVFHHAGMSTPLAVGNECLAHIDLLNPLATRYFEVVFADDARFWMASSLHLTPGARFDFHYQPPAAPSEGAGELELF